MIQGKILMAVQSYAILKFDSVGLRIGHALRNNPIQVCIAYFNRQVVKDLGTVFCATADMQWCRGMYYEGLGFEKYYRLQYDQSTFLLNLRIMEKLSMIAHRTGIRRRDFIVGMGRKPRELGQCCGNHQDLSQFSIQKHFSSHLPPYLEFRQYSCFFLLSIHIIVHIQCSTRVPSSTDSCFAYPAYLSLFEHSFQISPCSAHQQYGRSSAVLSVICN